MTTRELTRLTMKWAERLRLQDWDIKVRFAKKGEGEDYWGVCIPSATTKEAVIIMQNPSRHKKAPDPDYYNADTEVTLVHELMHLHFAPFGFPTTSLKGQQEEVIVSHVAQLLVALDRGDETILNPNAPRYLSRVARFERPAK